MKLQFTSSAISDLKNISSYISDVLENPAAAQQLLSTLMTACTRLKDHPYLGVTLKQKYGIRKEGYCIACNRHLIVYKINPTTVSIIRILDTRTDCLHILRAFPMEKS